MSHDDERSYLYAQRFYFLAEQCRNIMQKNLTKTLRDHDLNHSQHLVLLVLRYAEFSGHDVISTDIANLLGLEKHSITSVVDKLSDRGLVIRERSMDDRRAVHLTLTESGRKVAAKVHSDTRGTLADAPHEVRDKFPELCDSLLLLRQHISESSDQPPRFYERAFQTLIVEGQEAAMRSGREKDPTP